MGRLSLMILGCMCLLLLSGCGGPLNETKDRHEFGSGAGRVYDRGGLPPRLGSIALGLGGSLPNTNTSLKGTPSLAPVPLASADHRNAPTD